MLMPQTVEHLGILDSLGVASGILVMTKSDLVDEEILEVATEEARDLVVGTFLEGKPVVAVSAHEGTGLDDLKLALKAEALALPRRQEEGLFRLPVDRIFSMPGAGVVVTGTCWSGAVKVGDKLTVQPTGAAVRVREVQVHGKPAQRGASGQRLALALHGVKKDEMERGFQIIAGDVSRSTRRLDVRLNVMPHYQGIIKNRQRVHVHHAGREVLARVVLLDEQELGGNVGPRHGLAQLHLENDLVAARDDRLVLRFYSPVVSIAGCRILDPSPRPHKRFDEKTLEILAIMEKGDTTELFLQNLMSAGMEGVPLDEAMGMQDHERAWIMGKRIYRRDLMEELSEKIKTMVEEYARRFPLRLGMPKEEARRKCKFKGGAGQWNVLCKAMAADGSWAVVDDKIGASLEGPVLSDEMLSAINEAVKELVAMGLNWLGLDNWESEGAIFRKAAGSSNAVLKEFKSPEVFRHLVDRGHAVAIAGDYIVSQTALEQLLDILRSHFRQQDEMPFAEFRKLSGMTRKLGIPMLEYLDQNDYTLRQGDVRVAGSALGV